MIASIGVIASPEVFAPVGAIARGARPYMAAVEFTFPAYRENARTPSTSNGQFNSVPSARQSTGTRSP